MPLTDEQAGSTPDWLGRPQPVGQRQLSLATATGGAVTGGPFTGPAEVVARSAPGALPTDVGGRKSTGDSPIGRAISVANLVRQASGLIPADGGVGATTTASGQLTTSYPDILREVFGTEATGAEIAAQLGAQGLGDVGDVAGTTGATTGAIPYASLIAGIANLAQGRTEQGAVGLAGAGASYAAGAAWPAAAVYGAYLLAKGLEKYGVGGYGVGSLFSGGPPRGIVTDILGGLGIDFGYGPSKAWQTFGKRVGEGLKPLQQEYIPGLIQGLGTANTPEEAQAALSKFKGEIGARAGGYEAQNPDPWSLTFPIPGATGTLHEGKLKFNPNAITEGVNQQLAALKKWFAGGKQGPRPEFNPVYGETNPRDPYIDALMEWVTTNRQAAPPPPVPPPTAQAAPAAPTPRMAAPGPSGALGFSRDVLEAA